MPAKDIHAELSAAVGEIDADAKQRIKDIKQDVKDSLAPLRGKVDDYFTAMLAEVDEPWKLKVLSEAKVRLDANLDKAGSDEDSMLSAVSEACNEIDNAIGWVVPKPVDAQVIEEIKKRDRAADMAERAAKGIGIVKE